MPGPHKNRSGLTLIELMVVLAVIGIMAAVTAGSFDVSGWLNLYRLRGSAKNLFTDMQKARMNAVRENRDWAIRFNTADGSYRFQVEDSSGKWVDEGDAISLDKGVFYGHGSATHDATNKKNPFSSSEPSEPVTFSGDRVTFNSLGLPSKSGYCYLANSDGAAFAIGATNTGVIKMKKWNGDDWQ
ncbi:GspH/FimT family pseudopilin [Desulfoferrobacter suflitae]|uniref:GspH/FimT family pseudopilin n=1 Tax=Desulfoferrobacter suflitae TaxID=2865782 RepID=UPI002164BCD2|nr:GspH/FimT family pseudopilin [Desulfoferrobacter suflitae]MCK8602484.1 GspH/FimT family pseudopilin [Desulfoferrobacter suflitae]